MAKSKDVPVKKETEAPVVREAHPIMSLRDEIDRVFDRMGFQWPRWWDPFREMGAPWGVREIEVSPRLDVTETEDAYEISAELPGMDEKDIEVTVTSGNLVLKGEKRQEKETKEKDYHLMERSYGQFRRAVRLPNGVDEEKIGAKFSKGVLTLTLPKTKEAKEKTRKIQVQANP